MSHKYYENFWIATEEQLADLQFRELVEQARPATRKVNLAMSIVSGLYVRYALIVEKLRICYDQICQVQKRFTIKKLAEAATARMLEFQAELVKLQMSEYVYVDKTLIELKLVPNSVEILCPGYFPLRDFEIQKLIDRIIERLSEEDSKSQQSINFDEMPAHIRNKDPRYIAKLEEEQRQKDFIKQIVTIIQSHERGRQQRILHEEEMEKQRIRKRPNIKPTPEEQQAKQNAALTIEKFWRGHVIRKKLREEEIRRKLLIGMVDPSWVSPLEQEQKQKLIESRRSLQKKYFLEYLQFNKDEKMRVLKVKGPGIMEDISDEIREWFHAWYDQVKTFDEFPDVEKGGTVLVVTGETLTPLEWFADQEEKRKKKEMYAANPGLKKKEEDEKKKALEKEKEMKKKEKERLKKEKAKSKHEVPKFKVQHSEVLDNIEKAKEELQNMLKGREFQENPLQKYYINLIHDDIFCEAQLELRVVVDEMMRVELDLLENALLEDIRKSSKKKVKPKKKPKKKKGKGKKGKVPKDLTGDRSTEDLFTELLDAGIIHSYPKLKLSDYFGDFSYNAFDMRADAKNPLACYGDVRRTILYNCIVPIKSENVPRPKSVCIAGPPLSGKRTLINIICSESNAVLFDITPAVITGKYPGKKGLKMLIHLINKMSRILQPSIIYIDGAEKPFYKKVPKMDKSSEPKRLKSALFKQIVKPIQPNDQVMLVGKTSQPWACAQNPLFKCYEKFILLPRTDYPTTYMFLRKEIFKYHGVDREFDCSSLAKVLTTYPICYIKFAINKVLTADRIIKLSYKPLESNEILNFLLLSESRPIPDEEFEKFIVWATKTPLGKKMAEYIEKVEYERQLQEALKSKQKKKKIK